MGGGVLRGADDLKSEDKIHENIQDQRQKEHERGCEQVSGTDFEQRFHGCFDAPFASL